MAKRGGFQGGMPGNMNNLMKQAQRMQRQMEESQREMEEKEYEATAGGGAVTVKMSGKKEVLYCVLTRIEIPELKRIVAADDYSAFVTITDVNEIVGKHIKKKKEETQTS